MLDYLEGVIAIPLKNAIGGWWALVEWYGFLAMPSVVMLVLPFSRPITGTPLLGWIREREKRRAALEASQSLSRSLVAVVYLSVVMVVIAMLGRSRRRCRTYIATTASESARANFAPSDRFILASCSRPDERDVNVLKIDNGHLSGV